MQRTPIVLFQEAPTKNVGLAFNLEQNKWKTFPKQPLGYHRKQIIITNDHNTLRMHVVSGEGTDAQRALTIFPNSSITIFTSDTVTVRATDGAMITPNPCISVLEVLYTGPGT